MASAAAPPAVDRISVANALRAEQVGLLYQTLPLAIAANALIAACVFAALYGIVSRERLAIWSVSMALALASRLAAWILVRRRPVDVASMARAEALFVATSSGMGLVWGLSFPALALGQLEPAGRWFAYAVVIVSGSGVAAAGAFSMNHRLLPPRAFIASILLPALVYFALVGPEERVMAVLVGIFIVFLYRATARMHAAIINESVQRHAATTAAHELAQHRAYLEEQVSERTQALAVAKQVAESANRAKGAFLANMSHEVRTPLNAVLGMTHLALRESRTPLMQSRLKAIDQASRHLLALLNDILDLSKIDAERLVLDRSALTVADVVGTVRALFELPAQEKGLQLHFVIAEDVAHERYLGDAMRLSQVLVNLVGNALKFTERGSIDVSCAAIERAEGHHTLRWHVVDTGCGIEAGKETRIFEAFEQSDSSLARKFRGTGLGLAICKRLCNLMGGDIGVHSEQGAGSTFWFTVRLERNHEAPPEPALLPQPEVWNFAGRRVLLIEDEPVSQLVAQNLLEEVGLQVDLASDGSEAILRGGRVPYALILMDLHLPSMSGIDAARAIRLSTGPNAATPILALTANAFDEDRAACLAAGMNGHVAKPIEPQVLYRTLHAYLPTTTQRATPAQ